MKNAHVVQTIAMIFLLIGGLNWGLIGIFEWNFIANVFGYTSVFTRRSILWLVWLLSIAFLSGQEPNNNYLVRIGMRAKN